MARLAFRNFTGGEVFPPLSSRYDLKKAGSFASCCENMLPNVHGDVERRPGTKFLVDLGESSVLMPFSFNSEAGNNYVMVFGASTLRIFDIDGNQSGETLTSPYTLEDVYRLSYAQVGDIVYLAHRNYAFRKITRSGDATDGYTWGIEVVTLNQSIDAPDAPSVTWNRGTGDTSDEYTKNETYTLNYVITAVDDDGVESVASEVGSCTGRYPSDWVNGDHVTLTWDSVDGAAEYNVYRESAGYYGFIGIAEDCEFDDQNYEADTSTTPKEDWNPFADGNNPGSVCFHQQRLVLGGTKDEPNVLYMSRTGDFESFRKSYPLQDDDPVEYMLASGSIDEIRWVTSFDSLLIGTAGAEYAASSSGAAITPSDVLIATQSFWGSSALQPLVVGQSVLHSQRSGYHIRDLAYSLEADGYAGNDLSLLAPQLVEGQILRQWCYQQSPGNTLWLVRADGVLLSMTYLKEQNVFAWARHSTSSGVLSVACVMGGTANSTGVTSTTTVEDVTSVTFTLLAAEIAMTIGALVSTAADNWTATGVLTVNGIEVDGPTIEISSLVFDEDTATMGIAEALASLDLSTISIAAGDTITWSYVFTVQETTVSSHVWTFSVSGETTASGDTNIYIDLASAAISSPSLLDSMTVTVNEFSIGIDLETDILGYSGTDADNLLTRAVGAIEVDGNTVFSLVLAGYVTQDANGDDIILFPTQTITLDDLLADEETDLTALYNNDGSTINVTIWAGADSDPVAAMQETYSFTSTITLAGDVVLTITFEADANGEYSGSLIDATTSFTDATQVSTAGVEETANTATSASFVDVIGATDTQDSEDVVLLVAQRSINSETKYYLERMMPRMRDVDDVTAAFYVDSGLTFSLGDETNVVTGLDHLEGETVKVLADGTESTATVADGTIVLEDVADMVTVGLPYTSVLCPLPIETEGEQGTTLGKRRSIGKSLLRVYRSQGGQYGATELGDMFDVTAWAGRSLYDLQYPGSGLFSGDLDFVLPSGQDADCSLWIVTNSAYPLRISALMTDIDFGEV